MIWQELREETGFLGKITDSRARYLRSKPISDLDIFHQSKRAILAISHPDTEQDETRDRIFASGGISIIHYCDAQRCREEPDRVVQEFLDILSQE
ncbi:hypothetical protein [Microcoleus sp. CAWBG58]|uniref:hypothetical protein n=1 Tax=Microcoleus sp. CAWBG58 TaxID=2841651 RepID=UPI0025DF07DD|nr:hypothetical protein [Microcoleus sp. CAWBG58]